MTATPTRAMVLAAGRGTRLQPLNLDRPKPLVEIGGTALIDLALDQLHAVGVEEVVANTWHLAPQIEAHLAQRETPHIHVVREEELLDTGGGVANALDRLGDEPFFVMNSDLWWGEDDGAALRKLMARWQDAEMDALLLIQPTVRVPAYGGLGDFLCAPDGRLTRRPERVVAPFVFTGAQILHPRLFTDLPDGPFSLNLLYDRAAEAERLYGVVHGGEWLDLGTPERLQRAHELAQGQWQDPLF